jgi:predicted nucleic acid-binding protein
MKSLDTNVLVYSVFEDTSQHQIALNIVNSLIDRPQDWIISEQVFFEFYRAVRNPNAVTKPLNAHEACNRIRYLKEELGVAVCAYSSDFFSDIITHLDQPQFNPKKTHDVILWTTLVRNGVKEFYTFNGKDFKGAGFKKLHSL